jgi:hypothetical protein
MPLYKKIIYGFLAFLVLLLVSLPLLGWWVVTSDTGKRWLERRMEEALKTHTELEAKIKFHSVGFHHVEFEQFSSGMLQVIGARLTWGWNPWPEVQTIQVQKLAVSLSYHDGVLIIPGITDVDDVEEPEAKPLEEHIAELLDLWPQNMVVEEGLLDMVINGTPARLSFDMDIQRDKDDEPYLQMAGKLASDKFGGKLFLETRLKPRLLKLPGFNVTFQITSGEGDIGALIPGVTDENGYALLKDAAFKIDLTGTPEDFKFGSELYTKGKMAIPGIGNFPDPRIKLILSGRVKEHQLAAVIEELYWGQKGDATLVLVPEKPILFKDMEWLGVSATQQKKPSFSAAQQGDAYALTWDGTLAPFNLSGNWVDSKSVMDKSTSTIEGGKVATAEEPAPGTIKRSLGTKVSMILNPTVMIGRATYNPAKDEEERLKWEKGSMLSVTASVQNLDIQTLMQYWVQETATAQGTLTGTFPIILTPDGVQVQGGKLSASENGRLRYKGQNVTGDQNMNILYQALEDFHYKVLESSINTPEPNKIQATIRLEGYNPAVYDGTPIQLNVNLNADYSKLWKSGNAAWNLEQALQDRVSAAKGN